MHKLSTISSRRVIQITIIKVKGSISPDVLINKKKGLVVINST